MSYLQIDRNRNPQPNVEVAESLPFNERWFDRSLESSSEPGCDLLWSPGFLGGGAVARQPYRSVVRTVSKLL